MTESVIRNDLGFQLVIGAKLDGVNYQYLYLDTCTEKRVNSSATIPTYPLQDGTTMSDHMYRNPDTFTIQGTFSMAGARSYDRSYGAPFSDEINSGQNRLTKVQSVFEYIKDNGILCDLTTFGPSSNGETRFKTRHNMAIKSITWIEKQISMDYTIEFQEVICVSIEDRPEQLNPMLPEIYTPEMRSLGDLLIGSLDVDEKFEGISPYIFIILDALVEGGVISMGEIEFIYNYISSNTHYGSIWELIDDSETLRSMSGIDVLKKYSELKLNNAWVENTGINNPNLGRDLGILAITAMLGFGWAGGIFNAVSNINSANRGKERINHLNIFVGLSQYLNNDGTISGESLKNALNDENISVNEEDIQKIENLLINTKKYITSIQSNTSIYQLSSSKDDNTDREIVLSIEDQSYFLKFTKINDVIMDTNFDPPKIIRTFDKWKLSVSVIGSSGDEVLLTGSSVYGKIKNLDKVITNLMDCHYETDCVFLDKTRKYEVYLLNTKNDRRYLCDYYIVVSNGHLEDNIRAIYDSINNFVHNNWPI